MVLEWLKERWLRVVVHVGALLPLAWLIWGYGQGQLTANPIREIILRTGRTALILLLLSLACTPIRFLFRYGRVVRARRLLGLYAFFYALLHLAAFAWLDYGLDWVLIVDAFQQRPFVQVGLAAFLILVLLAVTSTKGWMRRLGKWWKRLHRLAYGAALLVVVHFLLLVKGDVQRPLWYGGVLVVLLLVRVPVVRRALCVIRDRIKPAS